MADNVEVTAGTGTVVHADEYTHTVLGSGKTQLVKLVDGVLDSETPITVDVGVKANALRVAPASDITDATYIGDIKFGESLPTGANAIGKLAANTGVDIGDVDVLSIAAGDNNIGNVDIITVPAPLNIVGGGAEAAALRVTLANDSTGVITVDGTITANLSATDNTVLDNIDSNTDYGAVVGGGAEATALRVTIANNSTGLVSIDDGGGAITVDGTVTASNAAGDIAHDAADSGNPVKVGGKAVNMDGTVPGTAVVETDRANFITDLYGRQFVETTHPNLWSACANYAGAQTNTEIKATPGAGLSLYITDVVVSNGAVAGNIKFLEDTGTPGADKIEIMYFAINGGASIHFRTPIKLTANKNFGITSVTCTTHSVTVNGFIAP